MPELHTVDSDDFEFSDLVPVQEAHEFCKPVFSKWGFIRETRNREFNGMNAHGVIVTVKNKNFAIRPRLKKWFQEKYCR